MLWLACSSLGKDSPLSASSSDAGTEPSSDAGAERPPPVQISMGAWTPNRNRTGDVVQSDFAQLPLGQWLTVAGTLNRLREVEELPSYPNRNGSSGFPSIIDAWGGAAWNSENLSVLISGGGHSDASAAETGIFAVDAKTMRVRRLVSRQPLDAALRLNDTKLEPGEGFPSGYNVPLKTGVPGTNHTYEGLVWVPPNRMALLGFDAPREGGLFYSGSAKALVNLDNGKYSKLHWRQRFFDNSYLTATLWKNTILTPYSSFFMGRFDLMGSELTDWQSSGFDLTPTVPSFGADVAPASFSRDFVYGARIFCDLPERGEMVSLAAASTRIRYGAAQEAATPTWDTYVDAVTLSGPGAADFTAANLEDSGESLLSQGGAHYLHSRQEMYVAPNSKGADLYRITGLDTDTWTVAKLTNTGLLTSSQRGTYGRFVVFEYSGAVIGLRVSSVDNPIEVIRLR